MLLLGWIKEVSTVQAEPLYQSRTPLSFQRIPKELYNSTIRPRIEYAPPLTPLA